MVRLEGLEPPTYWFVASHSIQLSYSRMPFINSLIILAQEKKKCKLFFPCSYLRLTRADTVLRGPSRPRTAFYLLAGNALGSRKTPSDPRGPQRV